MESTVSKVLKHKGNRVVTVGPLETVAAVADVLCQNRIGAVPVLEENGRVIGIISERDIIRGISEHAAGVLTLPAEQLMSREVRMCSPGDPLVEISQVMTHQRIRHLPVVENGALLGIISIGDVVKERLDEIQFEVEALRTYIVS